MATPYHDIGISYHEIATSYHETATSYHEIAIAYHEIATSYHEIVISCHETGFALNGIVNVEEELVPAFNKNQGGRKPLSSPFYS